MVATATVTFQGDLSALQATFDEMRTLLKRPLAIPPEIVERILSIAGDFSGAFEVESATAGGTVTLTIKPSQLFLDLVAAVRALD